MNSQTPRPFALFLYGRVKAKEYPVCSKSPSVSLTINTDHPHATMMFDIAGDFSRHVGRNADLAKCYDIARSAIHGEPT